MYEYTILSYILTFVAIIWTSSVSPGPQIQECALPGFQYFLEWPGSADGHVIDIDNTVEDK